MTPYTIIIEKADDRNYAAYSPMWKDAARQGRQ